MWHIQRGPVSTAISLYSSHIYSFPFCPISPTTIEDCIDVPCLFKKHIFDGLLSDFGLFLLQRMLWSYARMSNPPSLPRTDELPENVRLLVLTPGNSWANQDKWATLPYAHIFSEWTDILWSFFNLCTWWVFLSVHIHFFVLQVHLKLLSHITLEHFFIRFNF